LIKAAVEDTNVPSCPVKNSVAPLSNPSVDVILFKPPKNGTPSSIFSTINFKSLKPPKAEVIAS
jgi:hypothetical protein